MLAGLKIQVLRIILCKGHRSRHFLPKNWVNRKWFVTASK